MPCQLSDVKHKYCDAYAVDHLADGVVHYLSTNMSNCNIVSAGKPVKGREEAVSTRLEDNSSIDAEDNALDDLLTCLGTEEAKAQL